MDEELIRMTAEVNETYDRVQTVLGDLRKKRDRLTDNIDMLKGEQNKLNVELVGINMEIENRKEKIDNILNDEGDKGENTNLKLDDIAAKCKMVLGYFINDVNTDGSRSTLFYKIEYGRLSIMRQVDEENMTFFRLKVETKIQFDKNENEFYFADEEGKIFLDDLNVKKSLFSLSSTTVKGFTPIIRVIDKVDKAVNNEKLTKKSKSEISENKIYRRLPAANRLKIFLKENYFKLIHVIIFGIFFACYINSCMEFRSVADFASMINVPSITNYTTASMNVKYFSYSIPIS